MGDCSLLKGETLPLANDSLLLGDNSILMGDDLLPLGDIFTLLGDSRVPATLFSVDTPLDFGRLLESSLELRRLSQFTSKLKNYSR